jgi:hypothetical protein
MYSVRREPGMALAAATDVVTVQRFSDTIWHLGWHTAVLGCSYTHYSRIPGVLPVTFLHNHTKFNSILGLYPIPELGTDTDSGVAIRIKFVRL